MDPTLSGENTESSPLRHGSRTASNLPIATAQKTFGTRYFLISTIIASIIPIIKLGIGLAYKGQCNIDQRIPTYMIVAGIVGLVLVGLNVLMALTFMCLVSDSAALTLLASCGICMNLMSTLVLSVFLFIWFILGCVWTFGVHSRVQYDNPAAADYCQPVLYKWTFALLILTIVLAVLQCCFSCFRSAISSRKS